MITLLFVGDGPRDAAMTPPIVGTILGKAIRPHTKVWARLRTQGTGYDRKLLFALEQARDANLEGVVATVDSDKTGRDRLTEMNEARTRDRAKRPPLPVALGCAEPHAEAWLLDDPAAIRSVLGLSPTHPLPSIRQTRNPKAVLDDVMATAANLRPLDIIGTIASELVLTRCGHKQETGFGAFEQEVIVELGRLG